MTICIVLFVIGLIGIMLSFVSLLVYANNDVARLIRAISQILVVLSATVGIAIFLTTYFSQKALITRSRSGPKRRVAAKIHLLWRTDAGRTVTPYDEHLENPAYHIVLITDKNERIEVETAESIWRGCIEGSWGYAELQGDWMGSYVRDPELYRRYSGR